MLLHYSRIRVTVVERLASRIRSSVYIVESVNLAAVTLYDDALAEQWPKPTDAKLPSTDQYPYIRTKHSSNRLNNRTPD